MLHVFCLSAGLSVFCVKNLLEVRWMIEAQLEWKAKVIVIKTATDEYEENVSYDIYFRELGKRSEDCCNEIAS